MEQNNNKSVLEAMKYNYVSILIYNLISSVPLTNINTMDDLPELQRLSLWPSHFSLHVSVIASGCGN